MRNILIAAAILASAAPALAQDQQLGARTKAMGGSYTAFEDDPVSVWLNPAGIATQPDQGAIAYQTYTVYPRHEEGQSGSDVVSFSSGAKTSFVEPALLPSYLGFVFQVGDAELPMAIGVCYARPFHLNYSFDKVDDPFQTSFSPTNNMEQSFSRFRGAFAVDFRIKPVGEEGFLTHVSVGGGIDLGFEQWKFTSPEKQISHNATTVGGGLGVLAGIYDNYKDLRVNLGVAYQSPLHWDFSVDPAVAPAFQMPQQVNVGVSVYLLEGTPLRLTIDGQWIEWSATANRPFIGGQPSFRDALNGSFGAEYRVKLNERLSIYPRAGYRRFEAPWADSDNLPMTSNYKLVLDTKASVFNIATFGVGVAWTTTAGKSRSVEFGGDAGGDAANFALGLNVEF